MYARLCSTYHYLAEVPLATLTPAQRTELARIVPAGKLESMQASGSYSYYRLGIGRDGTWHYFVTGD